VAGFYSGGVEVVAELHFSSVKTRLESGEGMSFAEFAYPLMQCWDWWELYQQQGIQIQIGGSDQYGNILSGIEGIKLMNKTHHDPVIRQDKPNPLHEPMGITVPLLTTPSGEKFGKSAGNAIWLAHDMTSTFELYQVYCHSIRS
jgi:tyrosyl-tRNA synthetase